MKVRLQRFMADCGVASRRECEEIIAAGRVMREWHGAYRCAGDDRSAEG